MTVLSAEQHDALQEIVNIGVGRAAAVLNSMLESHITLRVPELKIKTVTSLCEELAAQQGDLSSVHLEFHGPFSGIAALVFPSDAASKLVAVVAGEDSDPDSNLDDLRIGTLEEIGNIVINGVMGTINNMLGGNMGFTIPVYQEGSIDSIMIGSGPNTEMLAMVADTSFAIESLAITGNLVTVFGVSSFDSLLAALTDQEAAS